MNKLREDFRVGVLGAAAALFAISVVLLIARIDAYYAYLSWLRETSDGPYDRSVEDLWWIPVGIWHLILSVAASLLVHRHLTTRLRSPFLLWQVISCSSLLGWGLTFLLILTIDSIMTGSVHPVRPPFRLDDLMLVAKYASAAFACNVFYGSLMQVSSRQYPQFEELPSDSASVNRLLTTE